LAVAVVDGGQINAKTAFSIQQTLIELSHPQPCTPMQTDNATAHALLTNKILPKALKAMDMWFHWLRCRNAQGQFRYYWRSGTQNLADYFTKHHPATHHKSVRPTILTSANDPEYRKLFQNSGDSTKSEGTNNYELKENFQKLPKSLNRRAQKITREAKLPKIARKTPSWRGQNTCCAWVGGTFFPVVLFCQFLVLAGNRFWFTYLCP
jgi:hypothetical protein